MIMYFVLGLAIGGTIPTLVLSGTILKGLRVELKGHEEVQAKMEKAERDIKALQADVDELKAYTAQRRIDLPYDAMGDYFDIERYKPGGVIVTQLEQEYTAVPGETIHPLHFYADDWYHEEFAK